MTQHHTGHVCIVTNGDMVSRLGGEEVYVFNIANILKKVNDIDFTLVFRNKHYLASTESKADFPKSLIDSADQKNSIVQSTGFRSSPYLLYYLSMLIFSFGAIMKILSLNKKKRISLINSQDTGFSGVVGIVSKTLLNVPLIVHSHGDRVQLSRYCFGKNSGHPRLKDKFTSSIILFADSFMQDFVCMHANFVVAVSKSTKKSLIRGGVDSQKIYVVPIGIRIEDFKANSQDKKNAKSFLCLGDRPVVGYLGRLAPTKNVDVLVKAFAKLVNGGDLGDAVLLVVGDGTERARLVSLCEDLAISKSVLFVGFRTDVSFMLSAFDVMAFPSSVEGAPTVLMEAMASGVPIVAGDIDPVREILDQSRDGLLVPLGDVEGFMKAIQRLLKDETLRVAIAENVAEKIERFDLLKNCLMVADIYRYAFKCESGHCRIVDSEMLK